MKQFCEFGAVCCGAYIFFSFAIYSMVFHLGIICILMAFRCFVSNICWCVYAFRCHNKDDAKEFFHSKSKCAEKIIQCQFHCLFSIFFRRKIIISGLRRTKGIKNDNKYWTDKENAEINKTKDLKEIHFNRLNTWYTNASSYK